MLNRKFLKNSNINLREIDFLLFIPFLRFLITVYMPPTIIVIKMTSIAAMTP